MKKNIVIVHRPNLTAEEYDKRMKQIKEAAAKLLQATSQERRKK